MEERTRQAATLSEALKDTLDTVSDKGLSPNVVSALCSIRIGTSSLAEAVTPGCGIGPMLRELIEALQVTADVAG